MKRDRFNIDGAVKDLFQQDQPHFLTELTGGIGIKEFLNVELPKVLERKVDLAILLADDSILHIEIQSTHDREIVYRMLEYYCLLKRRYRRPTRQVLLYVGEGNLRMPDRLAEDGNLVKWHLVDIRSFDATAWVESGSSGDLALALLAGGGSEQIRPILEKAAGLRGAERNRLLAQLLVLAGLRGLTGRVKSEVERTNMDIDLNRNPYLLELVVQGRVEALTGVLRKQLESKFGPIPKWAQERIAEANPKQLDRWVGKILKAGTLEQVVGKR